LFPDRGLFEILSPLILSFSIIPFAASSPPRRRRTTDKDGGTKVTASSYLVQLTPAGLPNEKKDIKEL
jgi:hypothetical protein